MAEMGGSNRRGELLTVDTGNGREIILMSTDGHGDYVNVTSVLGASKYGRYTYSNSAQVNSSLDRVHSDNASSTATVRETINDGTGHANYIEVNGVLASAKYGQYIYTNAAQTTSYLTYVHSDNASSTYDLGFVLNDGTGSAHVINQNGVLASGRNALLLYSNVAQVNGALLRVYQDHASSTYDVSQIYNDGTGHGQFISAGGVLASGKNGLHVTSSAAQVTSSLIAHTLSNASSTYALHTSTNAGTGQSVLYDKNNSGAVIEIDQDVNDANSCYGLAMNIANAGGGAEFAFKFGGDEAGITAVGNSGFVSNNKGTFTLVGFVRIERGGTPYYMPYGTIA